MCRVFSDIWFAVCVIVALYWAAGIFAEYYKEHPISGPCGVDVLGVCRETAAAIKRLREPPVVPVAHVQEDATERLQELLLLLKQQTQ